MYRKIIGHFGADKQILKSMEELSELIQALARHQVEPSEANLYNIKEEIADCTIMIMQLCIIYNIKESEISFIKETKLARVMDRIKEGV